MLQRNLTQIWEQLRGKRPHYREYLSAVSISGIRGFNGTTRIPFDYPVSVLAGPNACGKSTVLFALACAYKGVDSEKSHTPTTIFPDFRPQQGELPRDQREQTAVLDFEYLSGANKSLTMRWSRGKSWNRSFFGRKQASQPKRNVYLRTLANLSNPSEVRSFTAIANKRNIVANEIDSGSIYLAEQILPFKYKSITALTPPNGKSLLYAEIIDEHSPCGYSEFHMSSGERALLHLSMHIAKLKNALVLIDEVETGLHPHTQMRLMLELQRIALRNELQIIVTTHSPIILDALPKSAHLLLERTSDGVKLIEPHKDLIQKALYGESQRSLSILCEDDISEAILHGIFDHLNPLLQIQPQDIRIGRDTGSSEFLAHYRALAKFDVVENFIFVFDGDVEQHKDNFVNATRSRPPLATLSLPSTAIPENWLWHKLKQHPEEYRELLSAPAANANEFSQELEDKERLYQGASDTDTNKAKRRFESLTDYLRLDASAVARKVAKREAERAASDLQPLISKLKDAINEWRN